MLNIKVVYYINEMHRTLKKTRKNIYSEECKDFTIKLISGITRESRNFLNAVLSITEALALEVSNNPYFKPFLDHIKLQIDKLWSLVDELTELKKCLEPLNYKDESLIYLISRIDRMIREKFINSSHTINVKKPSKIDRIYIKCDIFKLTQTIGYLVENAIQHSPENTEIRIIFRVGKKYLNIYVIDIGEGIPLENMEKIFNPFFTTKVGHRGFGLKFAKTIIISHNGNISIYNNAKREGCTAKIVLPLMKTDIYHET